MSEALAPYRGADGRYHFLYCTEHRETGDYYIGKHSTAKDLKDIDYQGSGDWVKLWRRIAREMLVTTPFQFFDDEKAAFEGERDYLERLRKLGDPRCRNISEGGDGRTSEDMRRTLARPEIKARHRAGVKRRWAKPEEVDNASAAAFKAFGNPDVLAKYVAGSARRWSKPEEHEKAGFGQRSRFMQEGERAAAGERTRAYAAANPEHNERNSKAKQVLWADPEWAAKTLAAQQAGRATKCPAGPNAKPVETPNGVFRSLTAAAKHFGIPRKRGTRLIKEGVWRWVGDNAPALDPGRHGSNIELRLRDARYTYRLIDTPWGPMTTTEAAKRSGLDGALITYRMKRTTDLQLIFAPAGTWRSGHGRPVWAGSDPHVMAIRSK